MILKRALWVEVTIAAAVGIMAMGNVLSQTTKAQSTPEWHDVGGEVQSIEVDGLVACYRMHWSTYISCVRR